MKKIKYLILFLLGLSLGLSSCNHKSEVLYHSLPIEKEYETLKYVFDRGEISKEELQKMPNLRLIINSEDEFPEENLLGLEELKESNIDFNKYTLLIGYYKLPGIIIGHLYNYAKDFENNIAIFYIGFKLDNESMKDPETENLFTYCRSAILVSKIPSTTEVEFRWFF